MKTEKFLTKTTLLLVSSLTVMAGATIAPALPSIGDHFSGVQHAGLWIRLMLTLPGLFIVLAAPLAGWFLDRSGRLRLLIPSMILYGIAGSSGLYLNTIPTILAGRALLGIAVAGIMTSATILVADYYQGAARSKFMGIQAAFMNFGGVAFLTAGGGLTELGWRWPFSIYLLAILFVPLVLSSLPEPVKTSIKANPKNPTVSTSHPGRLLALLYSVAFGGMVIFYFIPLQIPFYLKSMVGASPAISGMAIAVATLFSGVTALFYGRIRARMGHIPILALNFGLMGLGYTLIGLSTGYVSVISGLVVSGLGMGLLFPNLNVWLTTQMPTAIRGRAVGGLATAVFLGQFLSPFAGQPVVNEFGIGGLFFSAGILIAGIALLFVLFRKAIPEFINTADQPNEKELPISEETIQRKAI